MKRIISKILLFAMLFSTVAGLKAYAQQTDIKIYNSNQLIDLSYAIEDVNGKYYIAAEDLNKLVDYSHCYKKGDTDVVEIGMYDRSACLEIYLGSNIVNMNDSSILFTNPLLKLNDKLYVSLDLFAMTFSYTYDFWDGNIYLDIRNSMRGQFINGKIHLPEGETAPEGGLTVKLIVGKVTYDYVEIKDENGNYKDSYPKYSIKSDATPLVLFIPEGENSIPYQINVKDDYNIGIRYEIDNNNYFNGYCAGSGTRAIVSNDGSISGYSHPYIYNYDNLYIEIIPKKYITGKIYLPNNEIAQEDITGKIKMFYDYSGYFDDLLDFVIEKGSNSYEYRIPVADFYYNLFIDLKSDIYASKFVNIYDVNLDNPGFEQLNEFKMDIPLEYIKIISGTVSLPKGLKVTEDVAVTVYLEKDYYNGNYSDFNTSVSVVIPKGQRTVDYKIYDKVPVDSFTVFYAYENNNPDIFEFGYYSKDGMQLSLYTADTLCYEGNEQLDNINLGIIENKLITVNVSLPDNMVAEKDLYCSVYPYKKMVRDIIYPMPLYYDVSYDIERDRLYVDELETNGYNKKYSEERLSPAIKKGESKGVIKKRIPIINDCMLNILVFNDDRFFNDTFYSKDGTTSLFEKSTVLSPDVYEFDVKLLKQYKISGKLTYENDSDETAMFYLHTFAKADGDTFRPISNVVYNRNYVEVYPNEKDVFYSINVPSDVKEQVLGVFKSNYYNYGTGRYYSKNGLTDDINQAEVITINGDVENIDLVYTPYDPALPIEIDYINGIWDEDFILTKEKDSIINVCLFNKSDFIKQNLKIVADLYNSDDIFVKNISLENISLPSNNYDVFNITLPKLEKNITKCKFYVVDENNNIISEVHEIKHDISYAITANGEKIAGYGSKPVLLWKGAAIAPARMLADIIGCSIEFIDESQTLLFKKDDTILEMQIGNNNYQLNGVESQTGFAPELISDRSYVDINTIVGCFGYKIEFNEADCVYELLKAE